MKWIILGIVIVAAAGLHRRIRHHRRWGKWQDADA